MADISAASWSETDASNNAASPNGWITGLSPSDVKNVGRAVMGGVKRFYDHINATQTSTGSANAYVLTYTVAPAAYVTGDCYAFIANFSNTSTATLNVNSLGAKNLKRAGLGTLQSGDILINGLVFCFYDGTQFQIANPIGVATSSAIASPVLSGTITGTYTLGGTPTIGAASTSGTLTLGAGLTATGQTVTGGTFSAITLTGGTTNTGNTISGGTLSAPAISGATISGTTTNTGTLSGGTISGATFTSPSFTGTTLAGTTTISASGIISFSGPTASTLKGDTSTALQLVGTNTATGDRTGVSITGTGTQQFSTGYGVVINGAVSSGNSITRNISLQSNGTAVLEVPYDIGGSEHSVLVGVAGMTTSSATGFPHIPAVAGQPTSSSGSGLTVYTGFAPVVLDTTNIKLWANMGGAWQDLTPTPSAVASPPWPSNPKTIVTTTSTVTIPSAATRAHVRLIGGGGNGGASGGGPTPGGGGGAGAYVEQWFTGLTPANTFAATVGAAGGTTSLASGTQTITTLSANGGAAGGVTGGGGLGASTTAGSAIAVSGGDGADVSTTSQSGGIGAPSPFGGGGAPKNSLSGGAAKGYGAGGAGAWSDGVSTGGAGKGGVIIIEWYS